MECQYHGSIVYKSSHIIDGVLQTIKSKYQVHNRQGNKRTIIWYICLTPSSNQLVYQDI